MGLDVGGFVVTPARFSGRRPYSPVASAPGGPRRPRVARECVPRHGPISPTGRVPWRGMDGSGNERSSQTRIVARPGDRPAVFGHRRKAPTDGAMKAKAPFMGLDVGGFVVTPARFSGRRPHSPVASAPGGPRRPRVARRVRPTPWANLAHQPRPMAWDGRVRHCCHIGCDIGNCIYLMIQSSHD